MGNSLKASFTMSDIDEELSNFQSDATKRIIRVLTYVGEHAVNLARNGKTYHDQTGNLRSSIGYIIGIEGRIKKENIEGTSEGVSRAKELADKVLGESKEGYVLIVFAGMNYASAVESKGYDVISNSILPANEMFSEIKKGLNL